jgi:hypothetical protein
VAGEPAGDTVCIVSDPHKWDRWDRTLPRPLTRRRLAFFVGFRVFSLVVVTAMMVGALMAALYSPSQSSWTLFGLVALLWAFVVATYVFLVVLLLKARRSRRNELHPVQDS